MEYFQAYWFCFSKYRHTRLNILVQHNEGGRVGPPQKHCDWRSWQESVEEVKRTLNARFESLESLNTKQSEENNKVTEHIENLDGNGKNWERKWQDLSF